MESADEVPSPRPAETKEDDRQSQHGSSMSLDSSLDGDRPPSRRSSSSSSDRQKSEHSSPDRQKSAVDGETEPVAKKLTPRSSERDSSPDGMAYPVFLSLKK